MLITSPYMEPDHLWLAVAALLLFVLLLYPKYKRSTEHRKLRAKIAKLTAKPVDKQPAHDDPSAISIGEIRDLHRCRLQKISERKSIIDARIRVLDALKYESASPEQTIRGASPHELKNLIAIVQVPQSSTPEDLVNEIRRLGSHTIASWVRGGNVPYSVVLQDVSKKLGRSAVSGMPDFLVERNIIEAAFSKMMKGLSKDQQSQIEQELASKDLATIRNIGAAAGGLAIANMSGFALYTAASSSLAAVSGAVGLSLPFAAYTGMSSVLATATGPIGWAALGTWAAFKMGGPKLKITIPATLAIATIRARHISERDQEIGQLVNERDGELAERTKELGPLTRWLMQRETFDPSFRVYRSDVPRLFELLRGTGRSIF